MYVCLSASVCVLRPAEYGQLRGTSSADLRGALRGGSRVNMTAFDGASSVGGVCGGVCSAPRRCQSLEPRRHGWYHWSGAEQLRHANEQSKVRSNNTITKLELSDAHPGARMQQGKQRQIDFCTDAHRRWHKCRGSCMSMCVYVYLSRAHFCIRVPECV